MTIKLTTSSFTIREFEFTDLPVFSRYRNMPEVAKYQSWNNYSLDDAIALFEHTNYAQFETVERIGKWFQLAISDNATGKILGDLAVHFLDEHQVEIGFTVAPSHHKSGIATLAVKRLLAYLFMECEVHRVIAITDCRNIASTRVLEKAGFRQEAHFIKNVYFKGAWGDEFLFAMLDEEYKQKLQQ